MLTYLQRYEPSELVKVTSNVYSTKTHDSLKISNGKWTWWSQGIGGKSALDYLIKVRGLSFLNAVEQMVQLNPNQAISTSLDAISTRPNQTNKAAPKAFCLPRASQSTATIERYLMKRGIQAAVIAYCIDAGLVYESARYHNVVFVGLDKDSKPRYAMERGTGETRYFLETVGSDKRFSFSIVGQSNELHIFEGAIDLLSYCSLQQLKKHSLNGAHLLSLGGVTKSDEQPMALKQYLLDHPEITECVLHLDADTAGRKAATTIIETKPNNLFVRDVMPRHGKDLNDELAHYLRNREKER